MMIKERQKRIFAYFPVFLLTCIFFSPAVNAAEPPFQHIGIKHFKNYLPTQYDAQPQNWCILQDRRGVILVGNQECLLEYDGVSWRKIQVPNNSVRSITMDDRGTVYVGGNNEIGYLTRGAGGDTRYRSLVEHIPPHRRNFHTVWRAHAVPGGVYFRTSECLFRWDPLKKQFHLWKAEAENKAFFRASFHCGDQFFVRQAGIGLRRIVEDTLQPVNQATEFDRIMNCMMAPYREKAAFLVGTRKKGLYIYDGTSLKPFPSPVNDFLVKNQLYHGIRLASGDFALATKLGGLVIVGTGGRMKYRFDKSDGLPGNKVYFVYQDSQRNLWLALEQGITKIEYNSPVTLFDQRRHLDGGLVLCAVRHGNRLYVGTNNGLFTRARDEMNFKQVPGISSQCWSLLSLDGPLLAGTNSNVFQVENNIARPAAALSANVLLGAPGVPGRVWVGTASGLVALRRENGKWIEEHIYESIPYDIKSIARDPVGNLWLGTRSNGVVRLEPPMDDPAATRFFTSHGLPEGEVHVAAAAGELMVGTKKGLFRFEPGTETFIPNPVLGESFADGSRNIFRLVEDRRKHIWFHSGVETFLAAPRADGTYDVRSLGLPKIQVNAIYPDSLEKITWFAVHNGLLRFDTAVNREHRPQFPAMIRRVLLIREKDVTPLAYTTVPYLQYKDRNLRFQFAAPFFGAEPENRYRWFLEGYDEEWSSWRRETQKDYTNLDPGFYTFRVQAKNVYNQLGPTAAFQFNVLPPWYRTWWAFAAYAVFLLTGVFFIVRWRSWKLHREKLRLEQVIKERTNEIEEKNRQLTGQSQQLLEMAKVRSRFFANISHEFRTPLTLLMGPLEQILSESKDRKMKQNAGLMLRNLERLLGLVNQLLDLSKLRSGELRLKASPQPILPFLKGIVASFEIAAAEAQLDLSFSAEPPADSLSLYFDAVKLEKAVVNLLSNAVKFTAPGGRISLSLEGNTGVTRDFPDGSVDIYLRDTGLEIPETQLVYLFDRFYQGESTHEYVHKNRHLGSGLGLVLAKELVELHHGKIDVRSGVDGIEGTEFLVRLPMGGGHLEPGQVVEQPAGVRQRARKTDKIRLPLQVEKNEEEEVPAETVDIVTPDPENNPEKNIILVVEDSKDVREYIRDALEPRYRVLEAANGKEGIEKAKDAVPDLVISDIMMPETDGYELCRVLKNHVDTSHIPVVLLTARSSEEDILKGLETGADDYITKPFNVNLLCARVKNLVSLRRQLQLNINRQMKLQPAEISVSKIDKEFIRELQEVIETNLSDPDFNVDGLCKKMVMSRPTLYRKILALSGENPTEFIRSYRLKRAAQLLRNNFGTVTEVAFEVGFASRTYFTKCFKTKFHHLPSTYQTIGTEEIS